MSSEWFNAIRTSINSMTNRGTDGRSVDGSRYNRFQICSENKIIKNPPHIRDACPNTELLRNSSHHRVRTLIANIFCQKKVFEVFEEVHCLSVASTSAQNRRADIIVMDRSKNLGLILDLTICWETNDSQ